MNINKSETKLSVKCAYHPDHISRFRGMGGRWQDPCWVFPLSSEKMLSDYVNEQWGHGEPDTDVQVPSLSESGGFATWHGYVLASRKSRDWSVRLVESTGCNRPFPSSSGSMKHPKVGASDDALYCLRVPREFAQRHGLIPADGRPENVRVSNAELAALGL